MFFYHYRGLSPAEAEFCYLNTARTLELYGVELHYARVSFNWRLSKKVTHGISYMNIFSLPLTPESIHDIP